jgi:alpha-beta hydrolase superfamily lysophospholipase
MGTKSRPSLALVGLLACAAQPVEAEATSPDPSRSGGCAAAVEELRIPSREAGLEIFVQRARAVGARRGRVVLSHGAGSGGSSTWNLPGEYGLLRHLACAGLDAYGFDARGYGGSTRPLALDAARPEGEPVVRAAEVQADLQAVIDLAVRDSGRGPVDLVGWSWGCVVSGLYASTHPEAVRRLILIAPVWDRVRPSRHITDRIYREEARSLHERLSAPGREDPAVHRAFVEALFRFTPEGPLRLPNGPYRDLYGPDGPAWDASAVRAEVLVIRGERDGASGRAPALRLFEALGAAAHRSYVEIGDAGHFLFRRKGHRSLRSNVVAFLTRPAIAIPSP